MKNDINHLMQTHQMDAIWVMGSGQHNPAMVYLTGGGHFTNADLVWPLDRPATLYHAPMERDEAARSGLSTRSYSHYPMGALLNEAGGDLFRAGVLRAQRLLRDAGVTQGRVAVYGRLEIGPAWDLLQALTQAMPAVEWVGYQKQDILAAAMMTKDAAEIDRIRRIGKITTDVVAKTADFLSSHHAQDGALRKANGDWLMLGEVKNHINGWLAEAGAENPEGTIFAIGRDAGVPHSSGNPNDRMELGKSIVFDIFPCEPGGGYYYDFTRTWCLGYAPDDVLQTYEQVKDVYQKVMAALKTNVPFKNYQRMVCELFQAYGHPTILESPETDHGYVHSLGHGVGLKVHERPFSGVTAPDDDVLLPGVVATIEPGLYYPEKGFGCRLEDTIVVTANGEIEIPAAYPQDLILPVKK